MISSLEKNPANGGMPASASEPDHEGDVRDRHVLPQAAHLAHVVGVARRGSPSRRRRKSSALKNACVNRWNSAGRVARPAPARAPPSCRRAGRRSSTRARVLMSSCTSASSAAISMRDRADGPDTNASASGPRATKTLEQARATRYTPAATMVAAWISADTGVGPAIASGSQTCSGNWADLPIAPPNSSSAGRSGAASRWPAGDGLRVIPGCSRWSCPRRHAGRRCRTGTARRRSWW